MFTNAYSDMEEEMRAQDLIDKVDPMVELLSKDKELPRREIPTIDNADPIREYDRSDKEEPN